MDKIIKDHNLEKTIAGTKLMMIDKNRAFYIDKKIKFPKKDTINTIKIIGKDNDRYKYLDSVFIELLKEPEFYIISKKVKFNYKVNIFKINIDTICIIYIIRLIN